MPFSSLYRFYPTAYSITNRMITQTPISPYISPVSTYQVTLYPTLMLTDGSRSQKWMYSIRILLRDADNLYFIVQVQNPSWVTHQPYIMQHPVSLASDCPERCLFVCLCGRNALEPHHDCS